jgi:hypothetical protein
MSHREQSDIESFYLAYTRYLAGRLPVVDPLYKFFACLDPKSKEILGYCHMFLKYKPNSHLAKTLKEKFIPMLVVQGIAMWQPSELTELATKVSVPPARASAKSEIDELMKAKKKK